MFLAAPLVPISTIPQQMLPSTMPISLAAPSQSTTVSNGPHLQSHPPTSSASMTTTTMNGLHSNATYYPMQVFYYPTPPISPSIYLQAGHMHPGPVTLVLRGKFELHYQLF